VEPGRDKGDCGLAEKELKCELGELALKEGITEDLRRW